MCWATGKRMFTNNGSHALRKDMCQRPLVLHLKLQGAAKNDGLDAEKYFDKYHALHVILQFTPWGHCQYPCFLQDAESAHQSA
jgi:hypothetical protein